MNLRRFARACLLAAVAATAPAAVYGACCSNCPHTKTKSIDTQYSGMYTNCSSSTNTNIGITVGGIPGGGGGSGGYSGSGTINANCWVNYTVVDHHKEHDGSTEACSRVVDDGQYFTRNWSGGGCEFHNPIGPNNSYYTCKDLSNTSNNPATNQKTEDCAAA